MNIKQTVIVKSIALWHNPSPVVTGSYKVHGIRFSLPLDEDEGLNKNHGWVFSPMPNGADE